MSCSCFPIHKGEIMLWLIWIAIMLLVPALVGVQVWLETHQERPEQ